MKLIPLTQGLFAKVDDADFEWLNEMKWRAMGKKSNHNCYYAITGDCNPKRGQKTILMHRLIMKATDGVEVDHRDNNGLNNQRYNLRVSTHAENLRNQKIQANNKSSKFKGVSFFGANKSNPWTAQIHFHKKKIHLGYFKFESDAAKAYDEKAKELFGEFAHTNF
jgi:hypothetical protein